MLLELAKKLNFIDNDLALSISASKDGRFTFGVYSYMLGDLYTYQSTSVEECYKKVLEFADCLKDSDKFSKLIDSILNEPLEV